MMAGAGALHAIFNQLRKIHANAQAFTSGLACFQNFLNCAHQAVRVFQHEPVEVAALGVIDMGLAAFESLQVKANGRDRSFQFMSNCINEAVMLLIAANFADQKAGIENQASGYRPEEDDPEKNFNVMLPVQDDPAETNRDRD